jgi:hypothetical protein
MSKEITVSKKIDSLSDDQIREMAVRLGRPYLDVIKDLQAMKRQSEYYRSDAAKEAAKRYRDRAKERKNALKSLLS